MKSAWNTSKALGALAAVVAAVTVAGCTPGGSNSNTNQTSRAGLGLQGQPVNDDVTADPAEQGPAAVTGELLVKFKHGTPSVRIAAALPNSTAKSVRSFALVPGLRHVKLVEGITLDAALDEYRARPDVEYAEPNYIVHADAIPNDPRFSEQWGLNNTGQTGGVLNEDIDAPEVWDLTRGDSSVVVAVIDSGVDYTHPDLAANMYRNVAECSVNGLDDDGNGYVDDCYGIDTANGDSDPADDTQHGTHVAGILGAAGNNGIGIAGVAWNVKILPCKFLDASGTGTTAAAIACLEYVAALSARGVNIVATNNSWGGDEFSRALAEAIDTQRQHGILFMAAAGNFRRDHDYRRRYPCDHDVANIVCVASITARGETAWSTDTGRHSVHIGAPGDAVLSTLPGDAYGVFGGTSMAAPHVTGIAALLKAQDPTRDWRAIRNLILTGGKGSTALRDVTITGREASAFGSLTCSNSVVMERLWPIAHTPMQRPGDPVRLSMLHINCANPNGAPSVSVSPGGETVLLHDDGLDGDAVASDGIYSATWTSLVAGEYTLSFPDASTIDVMFDAHLRPGYPIEAANVALSSYVDDAKIHTLVGNIDMDPEPEILRTALWPGLMYAWNDDGTLATGWPPALLTGGVDDFVGEAYPVLGRFTNSNHLDVFVSYTSRLQAVHSGSGQTLLGWPMRTNAEYPGASADLDGDGIDEILVEDSDTSSSRNFLEIHRPDGARFPGRSISLPTVNQWSKLRTPVVADLFGDGTLEIVTADDNHIYAHRSDGSIVSGFPVNLGVRSLPVVGDVDGDGAPEIVVVSYLQERTAIVGIVSNAGVIERTIATPFEVVNPLAPALADLDADGIPEIVIKFGRVRVPGGLAVWRGDGTSLVGWPVLLDESSRSAAVVGDVSGDGMADVVVTTNVNDNPWFGEVRAYSRHGQLLAGFPKLLPTKGSVSPAIADLDLDGRNELIVSTAQWWAYDGRVDTVYAFDLGGATGHAAIEWGQFMSDEKHSGSYKTGKNLGANAYLATQIEGTGAITSSPAGIDCGTDCIGLYAKGTTVALTASAGAFGRWLGACEGQGNPCVISIQDYTAVRADFRALALSVTVAGPGSVTSAPPAIACPGTCNGTFAIGQIVTLTATPQPNAHFTGWSGACSGTGSCNVSMEEARSVTASFSMKPELTASVQGAGTITSSPAGIDCGSDCSHYYDLGTAVTLTATPAPGFVFHEWQGACNGAVPACTVSMDFAQHARAVFFQETLRQLVVTKTGTGSGSVVSDAPGIDCGADCVQTYSQDTTVILTARHDEGSSFTGWSGACSGSEPTCTLLVSGQQTAGATFAQLPPPLPPPPLPTFALNVMKLGSGGGVVTSQSTGIDCGNDCSETYQQDTVVTLAAAPNQDSVFVGWAGVCSGPSPTCSVTMSQVTLVTAIFNQKPALTVTLSGNGSGTVTSSDGGIGCANDCSENYLPSAVVTLTATVASGSVFDGWTGACSGQSTLCSVTMDTNKSVSASFRAAPPPPPSDSGGKGGGGQFDWALLALGATLLLCKRATGLSKNRAVPI